MPFDELYGLLADNTAAVEREDRERDRPEFCPYDGTLLLYARDERGETAVCPLGNYQWP